MATLYHQVWIDAPVAKLYDALSSAAGLSRWWAPHTSIETAEGLVLSHNPGPEHGQVDLKVLESTPGKRLEWEVTSSHPKTSPASAWTGTHLVFELTERDNPGLSRGVTSKRPRLAVLEFRHTGWDDDNEYLGFCNFGWGVSLFMLKNYCESTR